MPEEIKQYFQVEYDNHKDQKVQLTDIDQQDLQSFIHYSRNYELCIAALNKFVMLEQEVINNKNFPDDFKRVLQEKIVNKKDWKQIASDISLNGKEAARQLFKKAISFIENKNKTL